MPDIPACSASDVDPIGQMQHWSNRDAKSIQPGSIPASMPDDTARLLQAGLIDAEIRNGLSPGENYGTRLLWPHADR